MVAPAVDVWHKCSSGGKSFESETITLERDERFERWDSVANSAGVAVGAE
jgi:hypothetical protein